jgi:AraC-like DNA-binding protein
VALAFAAGGGGAYAASQSSGNPPGSFLNDVAKRLSVSPQRLASAIKAATIDRLNAAVKDGRLSRAQANVIEHQIEAKGPPFVGPGPGAFRHQPGFFGGPPSFGPARPLAAAAGYLGLSELQLLKELRSGRSLAQIAKARHKSVTGLERAITSATKLRLDQAVRAGRTTKSHGQQLLRGLCSRLGDLVNRTPPFIGPGPGGPPVPRAHASPVPPF